MLILSGGGSSLLSGSLSIRLARLSLVQQCESLNPLGTVVAMDVPGDQDTRLRFLASLGDGG